MDQSRTPNDSPKGALRETEPRSGGEVIGGLGRSSNTDARDQCFLGDLYARSMLYEYAVEAYKRAIQHDRDYATAHHNLAIAYYKLGFFAEALVELKAAIKLWPALPQFHFTLGLVLKDDKKWSEAIASFSKAISLDPDYSKAYYRRGRAYYLKGNIEAACSDLEKAISLVPDYHDALYNLSEIYIILRKWQEAGKVLNEYLALKSNDSDALYNMGLVYVGSGEDSEQAMDCFQKVVDINPGHSEARFQLSLLHARMRYRQPSHRQEAIAHLCLLIGTHKELGDFTHIHDAFFLLGSLYDDSPDDADLAIAAYENGLKLAVWSAEAHNNLGVLYSQKGSIDDAVKEFREAIRLDPEYESPYRNLAKVYFYQRNEEMIKGFQQWIEEVPEISAKMLFNLSLALLDVGRAEAYESIYSKAHRIKNLIGVVGSKFRRLRREVDGNTSEKLQPILADQEKCYNEMVGLLDTLKQDDMLLDMVDINVSIESVLRQTDFRCEDHADGNVLCLGDEDSPHIECFIDLAEDLPRVKGDPRKLKEALNNIIINSLQAMENDGYLKISTRYSEITSGVEISLQDTGIGISTGDLDNIFKPGYTTKESGSGFGLSIVDRIIKEHKGNIQISSHEGEGTEIIIYLPVNLESSPIQTSLRMRPVIYEDPSELIFTEVDQIVDI